jgi:hypothetical protein
MLKDSILLVGFNLGISGLIEGFDTKMDWNSVAKRQ